MTAMWIARALFGLVVVCLGLSLVSERPRSIGR